MHFKHIVGYSFNYHLGNGILFVGFFLELTSYYCYVIKIIFKYLCLVSIQASHVYWRFENNNIRWQGTPVIGFKSN